MRETTSNPLRPPPSSDSVPDTINWATLDPACLANGDDDSLVAEMVTYQRNLTRLLEHSGDYVLIHGAQIIGVSPNLDDALIAGVEQFGEKPALIKQIVASEPIGSPGGIKFS